MKINNSDFRWTDPDLHSMNGCSGCGTQTPPVILDEEMNSGGLRFSGKTKWMLVLKDLKNLHRSLKRRSK